MSYLRLVLVSFQGIVHELEEVWGNDQIVFQYNDSAVLVDLGSYSIDDIACQSPILIPFDDDGFFESTDGMDVASDFIYSRLLSVVFGAIGINVERRIRGK